LSSPLLLRPPIFTLFPYTTLFRSSHELLARRTDGPGRRQGRRRRLGPGGVLARARARVDGGSGRAVRRAVGAGRRAVRAVVGEVDRKSTRLNSSHVSISYAVFCLK